MIALLLLWTSLAHAHDNAPGVLSLVEEEDGYAVAWTPPVDTREEDGRVRPVYPGACELEARTLRCDAPLRGIAFEGVAGTRLRVLVALRHADGTIEEHFADGVHPAVSFADRPAGLDAWIAIGAEHVLLGPDHLAFLLGLVLVSALDRRLFFTVTAFTLAHSLTLALATLGVLSLASRPVEASIALSILLVAREALRPEAGSLTRRAPWLVAGLFGLVHGLGFAGALSEIGLPRSNLVPALLGFNVGVELAQLACVAAALGVAKVATGPLRAHGPRALAYGIGALGAYWLLARTALIVVG